MFTPRNPRFRPFASLGLALVALLAPGWAGTTDAYKVDAVHSSVLFRVRHMDVSYAYGRFDKFAGTFNLDEKDPSQTSLDIKVEAESIDTNNGNRDLHLKDPDFFNTKQFPAIAFKSKKAKATGKDTFEVSGEMTMHGVTKPMTITLTKTGEIKNPRGPGMIAGFESHFNLRRSDFGMTNMVGPIGDEINVTVAVEGGKG